MEYSHKNIKVLEEVEHVRQHPTMYIGTVANPVHLIEEALDNALDELLAGYGDIVAVILDTENYIYQVLDNARGIPISNDTPVTICFKLFSGGKFDRDSYKISAGLHGIGLSACNFLSKEMTIEIYRKGKHAIYRFKDQKLHSKEIENFNGSLPFSTRVEIRPDPQIFDNLVPDIERLRTRLYIASLHLPNATFVLHVNGQKEVIKTDPEEFFTKVCLSKTDIELLPPIVAKAVDGIEEVELKIQYSKNGSVTPRVKSSVNLLPLDGGTHINMLYEMIRSLFQKYMRKYKLDFLPNDALMRMRAYLSLKLKYPKFSSQDKKALSNSKSELEKLFSLLSKDLESKLTEDLTKQILELIQSYRDELNSKKVSRTKNGKRAAVRFTSLRDCSQSGGELFIVEGESAAGGLIQCRDPKKHAVLPLKGKVPNVVNFSKILKNKEIAQMFTAIGTGVGKDFDISKVRYDKIIVLTDADPDGGHIVTLILMALAKLTPELVRQGYVYCCDTPLYAYLNGKDFKPLWNQEEIEEAREKKKLLRIKGLGELSPWQLKICALGKDRRLIQVSYPEDAERFKKLEKLLNDPKAKRKLLESKDGIHNL